MQDDVSGAFQPRSVQTRSFSLRLTEFTHLADGETERGVLELLVDDERLDVNFGERSGWRRELERQADRRALLLGIESRKRRLLWKAAETWLSLRRHR